MKLKQKQKTNTQVAKKRAKEKVQETHRDSETYKFTLRKLLNRKLETMVYMQKICKGEKKPNYHEKIKPPKITSSLFFVGCL